MRLTTLTLLTGFIVLFSLVTGCGGTQKPEGFPALIPHTLAITNNGVAEGDVSISLLPQDSSGSWAVAATTGSDGKAKLATMQGSYTQFGVPAGKYKVVLAKTVWPAIKVSDEEYSRMTMEEREAHGRAIAEEMKKMPIIIPESLTTSKTPLVIEISKDKPETVVELNDFKN